MAAPHDPAQIKAVSSIYKKSTQDEILDRVFGGAGGESESGQDFGAEGDQDSVLNWHPSPMTTALYDQHLMAKRRCQTLILLATCKVKKDTAIQKLLAFQKWKDLLHQHKIQTIKDKNDLQVVLVKQLQMAHQRTLS